MKRHSGFLVIAVIVLAAGTFANPAFAQQHRGNGGRIPPAPPSRAQGSRPEVQRFPGGQVDARPHVAGDHWYGHDVSADARFRLAQPFERGRLERLGPTVPYRILRFDAPNHRFWFSGGFGFEIAAWDWPFASLWCWSCPDDIIVYNDPDHLGWYLIYNTETGVYVHARYLGM